MPKPERNQRRIFECRGRFHRLDIFSMGLLGCLALASFADGQVTNYDFNVQVPNVYTLAIQADGKILVASGQSAFRLNTNGNVDPAFAPVIGTAIPHYTNMGTVYTMAPQEDGKVLVGGSFTMVNGQAHTNVARLNTEGSLDTSFNVQTLGQGVIFSLAFESNRNKLLGGSGFRVPGQSVDGLARIDAFDNPDNTFNPGSGVAYGLAVQGDGKILVSGEFDNLGGAPSGSVGRLNSDGSSDPSFNAASVTYANCMAGQADGKILIGTQVTENGVTISNLARLNSNGSLDTNFDAKASPNLMNTLAVQCDGKILVGGSFTTLGGQPRKGLGRVNRDGTVDMSFLPLDYRYVMAIGLDRDGKILVGGSMIDSSGGTNWYVGRMQNTGPATESLSWDGAAITWMRGGTAPEIWGSFFQSSSNGMDWNDLGPGQRIPGGWILPTSQIQPGSTIRASGNVSVGQYNGTSWFVQSYLQIPPAIAILSNANLGFAGQGFGFDFVVPTNSSVIIEISSDLLNWTATATNNVSFGTNHFTDPTPGPSPRFYRLRRDP